MNINKAFVFSGQKHNGHMDEPTECPRCHHAIKPVELYCQPFSDEQAKHYIAALYLCQHCYEVFSALYSCKTHSSTGIGHFTNYYFDSALIYIGPSEFKGADFEKEICDLSPDFVRIYNQAEHAEALQLNDIAGLGYRKALEFLIKDFCIHTKADKEDEIKKFSLSTCISEYIQNESIKTLASRSAWLGNDEAHYLRKHENRDIKDLKKFIRACVYFVGMTLVTEDAASISPGGVFMPAENSKSK